MNSGPDVAVEPASISRATADWTPVELDASELDSTAPDYLRDLKLDLVDAGLTPAALRLRADFSGIGPDLDREIDRVRGHVRAAAFLGAGEVRVSFDGVSDRETLVDGLADPIERARAEGIRLEFEGPLEVE